MIVVWLIALVVTAVVVEYLTERDDRRADRKSRGGWR